MIIRTPSYYKNFKCIAGACPDSCCQGWEVDADAESLAFYATISGEIKKKIDSVISSDEFGNTIFTLTEKKRCPFLNDENLCDMHIAIGGEHTPYTCRTYPRFINNFGAVSEIGLSFSCPVAADMIFNLKEPLTFVDEKNDLPPKLNEIDAQTYYYLLSARKKAFEILQNRNEKISGRLTKLIDYGVKLQKDLGDYSKGSDKIDFFDVFRNPELINPEWQKLVDNGKISPVKNTISNENTACYFVYRYFLNAVFDYDVLSKIKMAAVGTLILTCFGNESRTIQLWSKETEHSQYNMDRYKRLLKSADCLSAENLKKMLRE